MHGNVDDITGQVQEPKPMTNCSFAHTTQYAYYSLWVTYNANMPWVGHKTVQASIDYKGGGGGVDRRREKKKGPDRIRTGDLLFTRQAL